MSSIILHLAVKLIGKLQDGTVFLKKGHGDGDELFEFKTDDGKNWSHLFLVTDFVHFCAVYWLTWGLDLL